MAGEGCRDGKVSDFHIKDTTLFTVGLLTISWGKGTLGPLVTIQIQERSGKWLVEQVLVGNSLDVSNYTEV